MRKTYLMNSKVMAMTIALCSAGSISAALPHTQPLAVTQQTSDGITVKGKVLDDTGEPVIGATVKEKGTNNATVTDLDGNFSLKVPAGTTLQISYIGFTTKEVKASTTPLKVTMGEDKQSLDEVVVVGYGTQKKANLTGSVSAVDSKDLGDRALTSTALGIQGKMAGVTIVNPGGTPGRDDGGTTIRVRGTGTFNNASPMIVVDGMESTMYDIDPNDIESISVLKDAASAAIYGSKAANGVILITTKRGKVGKAVVSYAGTFGWQSPTRLAKYVNSAQYARLTNEARANEGKSAMYTEEDIALFEKGTDTGDHANTDWYDLFYDQSGFQMTHNLRISGGTEAARYMMSAGYTDQNGIVRNSGLQKYNFRINLDSKVSDRLDAAVSMVYTREDIKRPSGPNNTDYNYYFYVLNKLSPMVPCYKENGDYGYIGDGNPIAWFDNNSVQDQFRNNLQASGSLTYHFLPELSLKGTAAYKLYFGESHNMHKAVRYDDTYTQGSVDKLTENVYRDDRISGDILLKYEKTFGKAHNVSAMAGYHAELYRNHSVDAYRDTFASSLLYDLDAASAANQTATGNRRQLAMTSYFGRVNYDYMGKYLFEADFRYDGTSRFARGHRWGAFPSVSAGWRISEEKFFEPLRKVVDNVKLRASWGKLGNQDVGSYYPTISTLSLGQNYAFGGTIHTGAVTVNAVNPLLMWEATTTWGVGLDVNLFNRLSLVMDYYNKTTDGILMTINTPITYALSNYYDNVGKVRNTGFEFSATWNDRIGKVGYSIGANISFNHNRIESMGGSGDQYNVDTNGATYGIMRIGEAMHSFYGYKTDGFFQSEEEIAQAYPKGHIQFGGRDPQPGDIKYVDANHDGRLDANDRCVLGSWDPGITFGFNLGANWKGFDLMAVFQGATNVKGYVTREGVGYINGDTAKPTTLWLDHWTPDNRNAKTPRLIQGMEGWSMPTTVSDFWMQDATYLRLKTLQVGYSLPKSWLNKIGVAGVRVFYTAENLFTLTSFMDGYDPEAPVSDDNMKGNYYPQTKTHSIGINVTF